MRFPTWLTPLLDAQAMRATDSWAIDECGVPSLDLMERAGTALARRAESVLPDGTIGVVCGRGNNGGDGLVAARLLRDTGRLVHVIAAGDLDAATADSLANLRRLPGEAPVPLAQASLDACTGLVDALLGTGFSGVPHGEVGAAIVRINARGVPVVAADVPSGVDASTGAVAGEAVRATATVTFHVAKPGLWIRPGKEFAGEVHVVDIGIPRGTPAHATIGLIDAHVGDLLPRRRPSSTKFSNGHVLICGGSRGLTGAPSMAAMAASRAGAGYVTVLVPRRLEPIFEGRLLEPMTRGLPDDGDALVEDALDAVLGVVQRSGALALGPGLGRSADALALAREIARCAQVALVLDADGLNAHQGRLAALADREAPTVLTPHAGELARLLDISSREVEGARLAHARAVASAADAIVVLKGDDTLICSPDGRVAVSADGTPALATAGTGDVLTGVVAAMLAGGIEPFAAASLAVWLHAQAGRAAASRQGSAEGVIASDVIAALPAAMARAVAGAAAMAHAVPGAAAMAHAVPGAAGAAGGDGR